MPVSQSEYGRLPIEVYHCILDELVAESFQHCKSEEDELVNRGTLWRNKTLHTLAAVCRIFRSACRIRMSNCILIDARTRESNHFTYCGIGISPRILELRHLMQLQVPNPLLDPRCVKEFILLDQANTLTDPEGDGDELFCDSLWCPSCANREGIPTGLGAGFFCIDYAVWMLYDILEPMINLETLDWTSRFPIVEDFRDKSREGPNAARSRSIGALMAKRKSLRHLTLGCDGSRLTCEVLPYIETLESIRMQASYCCREYAMEEWVNEVERSYLKREGKSVDDLCKGQSSEWDQILKGYGPGPISFLHVFLDRNTNLRRIVSTMSPIFTRPCNLPFWAILDVEVTEIRKDSHMSEAPASVAARHLKPSLLKFYLSKKGAEKKTISAEEVGRVIMDESALKPFRSWCREDPNLAGKVAEKFNWRFGEASLATLEQNLSSSSKFIAIEANNPPYVPILESGGFRPAPHFFQQTFFQQ